MAPLGGGMDRCRRFIRQGALFCLLASLVCAISAGVAAGASGSDDLVDLHFTQSSYNATIRENAVGKTYITPGEKMGIYRSDLAIAYKVIDGDFYNLFKADERVIGDFCFLRIRLRTGVHTVINRELQEEYRLKVKATVKYSSGRRVQALTEVVVRVLDENDLSPLFYPITYEVSVPENSPIHASVAEVTASDADIGVNGEIYYSFAERIEDFAIHPNSGIVYLAKPLSYSEKNSYDLEIFAKDRGPDPNQQWGRRPSSAKLKINVQEVNFYAPDIRVEELPSVIEHGENGSVYAIVHVTDRDSGDNGAVTAIKIVGGDSKGIFSLSKGNAENEYNIIVAKVIDRELNPYGFNLTVEASDKGMPPRATRQTIHVKVQDTNDMTPRFKSAAYEVSVDECVPVRTPLMFVNASDEDFARNGEIRYSIAAGNEKGWFVVSPVTGLVSVARPLDAEEAEEVILTLTAVDQANMGSRRQSSTTATVVILDCNDNAPVFNHSEPVEVTIEENRPVGSEVIRIVAFDRDADENGYISYSFAHLDGIPFTIESFTGIIKTKEIIDYETMRRTYNLRVRASDWGSPYRRESELAVQIKIRDVNDNHPLFEKVDCSGYLSRDAAVGTSLVTVSALDFEVTNIISYSIVAGNEDGCFGVGASTGLLTTKCTFTDHVGDTRSVAIKATDGLNRSDPTTVNITLVSDRNSDLASDRSANFNCRDTGVSRELARLWQQAADNNAPLDGDAGMTAQGGLFAENLNTPRFSPMLPSRLTVVEGLPIGTSVLSLVAQDSDQGYNGKLLYTIVDGNVGDVFKMNTYTGDLVVMAVVDRETRSHYMLNVTAEDMGRPSRASYLLLEVRVEDVNDNPPAFEKAAYSVVIQEDAEVNSSVIQVMASDRDEAENADVTYSILTDTRDFAIDRHTGRITVNRPLDRETQEDYQLKIQAVDGSASDPLSAVVMVTIRLEDVNDNAPEFFPKRYRVRVREDLPVGTVVLTIQARDPDAGEGGKVRYSLINGMDDKFEMDRVTGTIRIAQPLDFESKQIYNISARVRDKGSLSLSSKCDVIIEVVDVNENLYPPLFADFVFQGRVKENEPVNTVVMQLIAVDADSTLNANTSPKDYDIVYSIRNGSGLGLFTIDRRGYIRTTEVLDRETDSRYWLTIWAQDRGTVALSSMVEVLIEVEDVNDNVPHTAEPVYYPAVVENSPEGTSVVRLQAQDMDGGKNNRFYYEISAGNPQGFFHIDREQGLITTTQRKLDREKQEEHILEVTMRDTGVPPMSSTTRVVITVADDNDEAPEFTDPSYRVRLPATPASEYDLALYRVVAFDRDTGPNADIDYSLKAGAQGGGDRFKIHPKSGVIYSAMAFTSGDQYDLTVKAVDNGRPQRKATARVLFDVVPRPTDSPNPPTFLPRDGPATVMENDVIGNMVTLMSAEDPDGDKLWYSITAGNDEDTFSIDAENGNILLARALDWETKNLYNLTIGATDGVHDTHTWVSIDVLDINDHRPQFDQAVYTVELSETTARGSQVLTVTAHDADEDKRLFYNIHSSTDQSSRDKFKINSETDHLGNWTGVITTTEPLDREAMGRHELTIMVRDQGLPSKRSFAKVIISILDNNDHQPLFLAEMFEGRVFETAAIGSSVVQVMASDRDKGKNAQLKYSILAGNVGSAFAIDHTLGIISVAKPLDSSQSEYNLVVKATDGGSPSLSSSVPVKIQITISNNAPPRFEADEYTTELRENSDQGTHVVAVVAVSRSSVVYDVMSGDEDGLFTMNPSSGVLSCVFPIDYERDTFFNLTVRATNMVGATTDALVLIHVIDENDNWPTFTQAEYAGNISEAAPTGSVVLAADHTPLVVKATDADAGINALLEYAILEEDVREMFDVDPNTGAVRTRRPLDRETAAEYRFTVQVADKGEPRRSAQTAAHVVIRVLDVNDSPPAFPAQPYATTLLLSKFQHMDFPAYKDVEVIRIAATDADLEVNSPLTYSILHGNDQGHFAIDAATGVITVATVESMLDAYQLQIQVSDGVHLTDTLVRISVDFTPDSGLTFSQEDYFAEIRENTTGVQQVAVVQAVGHALNEHLTFSILNPHPLFGIGETSGVVRTSGAAFDREAADNYTLTVAVRDQRDPPRVAHAVLHVHVTDVNDNAPVFVNQPYFAIVSLDAGVGESVKKVTAIDRDVGDNGRVTYSLAGDADGRFTVDAATGEIVTKRQLTFEDQNKEYVLTVEARDHGAAPLWSRVTVPLTVMNEATPVFSEPYYSVSVPENVPINSAVLTIKATSPKGRKLIYAITTGDEYREFEVHFETDMDVLGPCSIVVQEKLDYELKKVYDLRVRATDFKTGAYSETVVNIQLEDVNDNEPSFESLHYVHTVSEAVPVGTSILTVAAQDADSGLNAKLHYQLQALAGEGEGDHAADSGFFHIDPEKGILLTKAKLDRERSSVLKFLVVAMDSGVPSRNTSAPVKVIVTDLNDNAPKLDQPTYEVTITDQVRRGQFVTKVTASDPDSADADVLAYSIVAGNTRQAFAIEEYTGIVSLSSLRKPDLLPSYALNVSVTDGVFTHFGRVLVAVDYSNNHVPSFDQSILDVDVVENADPGTYVAQVTANDSDRGKYGHVTYSIESEDADELFRLDPDTGKLYTRRPLDREVSAVHVVPIVAKDGGGRAGYTKVKVNVADQADHKPQFKMAEYKANIYAYADAEAHVLQVVAFDRDLGSNGDIEYSIYDGDSLQAAEFFTIQPKTGLIMLLKSLEGLENQLFQFFVRATDRGSPPQYSDVPVDVYVMGAEDFPPRFDSDVSEFFVYEDARVGSVVAAVAAQSNETLVYAVVPGQMADTNNPAKFAIDDGGRISIVEPLDREAVEKFELTVKAETRTSPPLVAFTKVIIQVRDQNDNSPTFESDPYLVSLVENAHVSSDVIQVIAHDRDIGANADITYGLDAADAHMSSVFSVDSETGWIRTVAALDREAQDVYTFTVVAKDRGSEVQLSDVTTVTVTVVDHNDEPPVFTEEVYEGSVNEDALPGTIIRMVSTTDSDLPPNNDVTYSLVDGDPLGQFSIRSTGEIYVNKALDREVTSHYQLTVAASDGAFVSKATVNLSILDANDNAPVFSKALYQAQVDEGQAPGYIIKVEATDVDEAGTRNSRMSYSLSGDPDDIFYVQDKSGIITTKRPLDRETTPEYHLMVYATDGGGLYTTAHFYVTVRDVNDNAPAFTMDTYFTQVSEGAEVNSLLARVSATDADTGIHRKVRYSLADGGDHFEIDETSGIVSLSRGLDREKEHEHNVTVLAYDLGTPRLTSTATLNVFVLDVNDNPPEFERTAYTQTVREDLAVGASVLAVYATSLDTGVNAQIAYTFIGGNDRGCFTMDEHTGLIRLAAPLDYESVREHVLSVEARDRGTPPLSSTTMVKVNVTDANDNPPEFAQDLYHATLPEDIMVQSNVIQVAASDLDGQSNSLVTYRIAEGDRLHQFDVNIEDGYIYVAAPLDREKTPSYQLVVEAVDNGVPPLTGTATLTVEILDVNDCPPMFTHPNYTAVLQVTEDGVPRRPRGNEQELGFVFLAFNVTDADLDPNGAPFHYDVVEGNEGNEFHLDAGGALSTAAKFNLDIKDRYELTVRVFDSGEPTLHSDVIVTVKIVEESSLPPVVTPLVISMTTFNDEYPKGIIGRVKAIDPDPYDLLTFSIVADDSARLFDIQPLDGTLSATQSLDAGDYLVNVSVTDDKFYMYTPVRITVTNIDPSMVENGVVVRFSQMLPEQFIASYRDPFTRALASQLGVRQRDVIILSVQSATDSVASPNGLALRSRRRRRSGESADLDVLLAVQKSKNRFYRSKPLRRQLIQAKDDIENEAGVHVARVFDDVCSRDSCKAGTCETVIEFLSDRVFTIITDSESFSSAQHSLGYRCVCDPGYAGPLCQDRLDVCDSNPCPEPRNCVSEAASYTCVCPEGTRDVGTDVCLSLEQSECMEESCRQGKPMTFSGNSYVRWRVTIPMESRLRLALEIRTVSDNARLMHAVGHVDYSILEIENGRLQYRFDCGSGEGLARVDQIAINDGYWHTIVLERTRRNVKVTIDRKYVGEGIAPGTNDVMNLDSDDVYFGAQIEKVGQTVEVVSGSGFVGCLQNIKLEDVELPLAGSSAVGVFRDFDNIRFHCNGVYVPGVCSSSPCKNGGSCQPMGKDSYMCHCSNPTRFRGASCEQDMNPCMSNPCMHGGQCENSAPSQYDCRCRGHLSGARCELGCEHNRCDHGGVCSQDALGKTYCECLPGYTGELCQMDLDECLTSPCGTGGTCHNTFGSYHCNCTSGLQGKHCDTIPPRIRSSHLGFDLQEILIVVGVVVGVLLLVVIIIVVVRTKRRRKKRRHLRDRDHNDQDEGETFLCNKLKNVDDHGKNPAANNIHLHNIPPSPARGAVGGKGGLRGINASPRPPPVPNRPVSYTPSTADSLNTLNNVNFDTVRNYGSAADELENMGALREPIQIPDFLTNVDVEKSPATGGRSLPPPPPEEEPLLRKSPGWDPNNLNYPDNYPDGLKKHNKCLPSDKASVQSLQLLRAGDVGSATSLPVSESEDDLAGYHWDTSDWMMDNAPLPKISELPAQEVIEESPRNSQHSNDSNVHIAADEYDCTEAEYSDYPDEYVENDSEYVGDSEYAADECGGADTDDPDADYPDRPNFQEILELQGALNFGSEENLRPNNYTSHPNQYLPEYNISENNSQVGDGEEEAGGARAGAGAGGLGELGGLGPGENGVDEDEYDDYNGNYSADNIARDDDDDVIYYGFPRAAQPGKLVPEDLAGNAYNYGTLGGNSGMDDMSVSMGGYTSTNVSTSDISGLCEIEDSEANLSDEDENSQSARLLTQAAAQLNTHTQV